MCGTGRIAFRTTAGEHVGFGHLRRCLSLAEALRQQGVQSMFWVDGPPVARKQIAEDGFPAASVAQRHESVAAPIQAAAPGAIVVDSYELGPTEFAALSATGIPVIAIDDCGDRPLPVDLVINGSPGAELLPYQNDGNTRYLLGLSYALLRPEFGDSLKREIRGLIQNVLITVGGSDPWHLTPRFAALTARTLPRTAIDVVAGPGFAEMEMAGCAGATLHRNPADMRGLMLAADLVICAGGGTTYELAATGTPAAAVCVADNQVSSLDHLANAGVLRWVGDVADADLDTKLVEALVTLSEGVEKRIEMSTRGRSLVDGQGSERVARILKELAARAPG